MRVYLDNCCYNRPFDPQDQLRVAIETSAKMRVQALMRSGQDYTEWRKNQFEDDGETIEELGEKIRRYSESRRGKPVSV